jgi:hypothetical protein
VTRVQYETFVNDLHHLSLDIGIRPAARAMGISEDRARKISSRRGFKLATLKRVSGPSARSPNVTAIEAKSAIIQHYGDRAKIGATIAGAKALEHLADSSGAELVKPAAAISGDQWTKAVDRAAGWSAARQAPVQVAVQVNMPSEAERAELRETDAKLDEIASLLRARSAQ